MSFANPLRALPTLQPASALRQIAAHVQHPAPPVLIRPAGHAAYVPTARELAQTALANAQPGLREAVRVHDHARSGIGQASRGIFCGHVVKRITAERRQALRRDAFVLFNGRRGHLLQARRRMAAAELALVATAQAELSAATSVGEA